MWKDVVIGFLVALVFLLVVTSECPFSVEKLNFTWILIAVGLGAGTYVLCRRANREYFDGNSPSEKIDPEETLRGER